MKILKFFKQFLLEYKKSILIVLLIKILLMLIPFLFPLFMKIIIDDGILSKNYYYVVLGVFGTFVGVIVRQIILIFSFRFEDKVSSNVIYTLRRKMSEKLLSESVSYFEKKNQGDLLTILNSDTERVENFAINTSYEIVLNFIKLIISIIILFFISWKLAIITFLPISIFPLAQKLFIKKLKNCSDQERESTAALTDIFQQTFSNIFIVLSYNLKDQILHQIKKYSSKLTAVRVKSATYSGLIGLFVESILEISTGFIVFLVGGYYVINNSLQLGSLLAFSYYLGYTISPVSFFYRINSTLAQINASFDSVSQILEIEPKIKNSGKAVLLTNYNKDIYFENVKFSYEKKKYILDKCNFKIRQGSMVAICGISGAGKSTIIKLLLRFHDVENGIIRIGESNIKGIDLKSLRSFFSLVPQDSYFFNKTIWENFKIIKPNVTQSEIDKYIKLVGLNNKIKSLEKGYQTIMGDQGIQFSGGERQRFSIVRALLRDSPVIIFDEATSQLDTLNEKNILTIIKEINEKSNKTIIMVAHKLSTVRKFKEILLLHEGKIAEIGSHKDLINKKKRYFNLWEESL